MGSKVSYVCKISELSFHIAGMMSGKIKVSGWDSLLREEPAYFDGMYSCVKYFVSLTLWVFHPAMQCMVIIAIMDALKEDWSYWNVFWHVQQSTPGLPKRARIHLGPLFNNDGWKGFKFRSNWESLWRNFLANKSCHVPMALYALCREILNKMRWRWNSIIPYIVSWAMRSTYKKGIQTSCRSYHRFGPQVWLWGVVEMVGPKITTHCSGPTWFQFAQDESCWGRAIKAAESPENLAFTGSDGWCCRVCIPVHKS